MVCLDELSHDHLGTNLIRVPTYQMPKAAAALAEETSLLFILLVSA